MPEAFTLGPLVIPTLRAGSLLVLFFAAWLTSKLAARPQRLLDRQRRRGQHPPGARRRAARLRPYELSGLRRCALDGAVRVATWVFAFRRDGGGGLRPLADPAARSGDPPALPACFGGGFAVSALLLVALVGATRLDLGSRGS